MMVAAILKRKENEFETERKEQLWLEEKCDKLELELKEKSNEMKILQEKLGMHAKLNANNYLCHMQLLFLKVMKHFLFSLKLITTEVHNLYCIQMYYVYPMRDYIEYPTFKKFRILLTHAWYRIP